MTDWLHIISQFSNLTGAILMGLSIAKDDKEWVEGEEFCKGKKIYSVLLRHPRFFSVGVSLLIIGFALDFGLTLYLKYAN